MIVPTLKTFRTLKSLPLKRGKEDYCYTREGNREWVIKFLKFQAIGREQMEGVNALLPLLYQLLHLYSLLQFQCFQL